MNRFGRRAEISDQHLDLKDNIMQFFDKIVDENANKLALAVHSYISSNWFQTCCELYKKSCDLLIYPLMAIVGIEDRGSEQKLNRSWCGLQVFQTEDSGNRESVLKI